MANRSNTYRARRARRPKKKYPRGKLWYIPVLVLACLAVGIVLQSECSHDSATASGRVDFAGKCLEFVVMPDETPEVRKEYEGFTVSFNPAHHIPNYVAWELTADEARGTQKRENAFRQDADVYGCPTLDDYRNSGFDRGHMAPAADMKWSREAMLDCHYLTNMCPQTHQLNGGRWATLEDKCRQWVLRDSALIIIAGPILSDELSRSIGRGRVTVPERFFKVILAPYANPPRAIAFIMPNAEQIDGLESLTVSVDQVEAITGFDFFSCLPDDVETTVEAMAKYRDWNRQKR